MTDAQPGWYPDPAGTGGLRWWDGRGWSSTASGYPSGPLVAPFPLASWGVRAGARILDILIMQVVTVPLLLLVVVPFLGASSLLATSASDGREPNPDVVAASLFGFFGLILFVVLLAAALQVAYEVVLTAMWGMTLGKRIVGIRVRSIAQDRLPSWLESFLRAGVILLGGAIGSGVFSLIDYLWPLWDKPWQQTLHDKVAKTVVVPR